MVKASDSREASGEILRGVHAAVDQQQPRSRAVASETDGGAVGRRDGICVERLPRYL